MIAINTPSYSSIVFAIVLISVVRLNPAEPRKDETARSRVFGNVLFDGHVARRFLVVLEKKKLEVLRYRPQSEALSTASTLGLLGSPFGLGPSLTGSALCATNARKSTSKVEWRLQNNKLIPEYIVVQKGQSIAITEADPKKGFQISFSYNSVRQPMPAVFNPRAVRREFLFLREEIGIVMSSVFRPALGFVSVLDHTNYCFTDDNGKFEIGGELLNGRYDLWVNHPRYGSWVHQVDFPSKKALEIKLFPEKNKDKKRHFSLIPTGESRDVTG